MAEFLISPDPDDPRLTRPVTGIDQTGENHRRAIFAGAS